MEKHATWMITLFVICLAIGCKGQSKTPPDTTNSNMGVLDYDTTISFLEKRTVDIITWNELFSYKEFVAIYENSSKFTDEAIQILGRQDVSLRAKLLCIFSMQSLNLEQYVPFLQAIEGLYNSGKVNETILRYAMMPNFSNRHVVIKNFRDSRLREVLKSIESNPKTSVNTKTTVGEILEGKIWENVEAAN